MATTKRRIAAWLAPVIVVVAAGGGYAGAAAYTGSQAGKNATVGTVDISGLDAQAATARIQSELGDKAADSVRVDYGDGELVLDPAAAGLHLDVAKTVNDAIGINWSPGVIWNRLTGSTQNDAAITIDRAKLETAIRDASSENESTPKNASIAMKGGEPTVVEGSPGEGVDAGQTADEIAKGWPATTTFQATPTLQDPEVTTAAAEKYVDETAKPFLAGDVKIATDKGTITVPESALKRSVTFAQKGASFEPKINATELAEATTKANPDFGTTATNAGIKIENGKPVIIPAKDGTGVPKDELASATLQAMAADDRTAKGTVQETKPDRDQAALEKLGIKEVISEFATPYNSDPNRDTNLRIATEKVTGTVLAPGESFSLNQKLGERTPQAGYKQAGVISDGRMSKDYGGGVSQVSTTLFNGAFFAGLQLDKHRAHSQYISRYPEGRESTLDWTSIDMAFTNNTQTGVLLEMWLGDGKVHARLWGTKTVEVEAKKSDRFNFTSSSAAVTASGANCSPQSPKQGWSVKITREIKDANSKKTLRTDGFTTTYPAVKKVTCG